MKAVLLALLLAAPLCAQLTPWIDLTDGWLHSKTGQRIRLQKGLLGDNPPGEYHLTKAVRLPPGTDTTDLAITLGIIHGAYRLSVNGVPIGETPDYASRFEPTPYARFFPLPPGLLRAGETIEIRLDITSRAPQSRIRYAGFALAGRQAAQALAEGDLSEVRLGRVANLFLFALAILLCGFILVAAYRSPHFVAAACLAAWLLSETGTRAMAAIVVFALAPGLWAYLWLQNVLSVASAAFLGEFLARMVPLPARWRAWAYPIIAAGYWWHGLEWLPVPILLYLRGRHPRALPLTLSVLLMAMLEAAVRQRWLAVTFSWGPLLFPYTAIAPVVFGSVLILLVARRLLDDRLKQERLSEELRAAATVQQMMLPSAAVEAAGWRTEVVYEPALEVGGDFYWSQIGNDGSLTVVVGDVSGKGLRAAMLAAFCTGVLRQGRGATPRQLLHDLNEALTSRDAGGFVTCCCARFAPNGEVSLATAGHPPPFIDGAESAIEAGLPLGVVPGTCYPETSTHGRGLTFVSDGVVEAENPQRVLFGFERTREISTKSAQEIAEAAKAWGQNDDITVVTVRRLT